MHECHLPAAYATPYMCHTLHVPHPTCATPYMCNTLHVEQYQVQFNLDSSLIQVQNQKKFEVQVKLRNLCQSVAPYM